MMVIHLAWWTLYLAIAHNHPSFAILALLPWMLFGIAFNEWAIGHQVITGWPKK